MTPEEYYKNKIEDASVDYTMNTNPMCIAGDAFADMARLFNKNPSFIAGCQWMLKHLFIPIEELKPENGQETLTRMIGDSYEVLTYYEDKWYDTHDNTHWGITHWIPTSLLNEPKP